MSGLSQLLTDIATEAKTYGGTEKALRVLRRRRHLRRRRRRTRTACSVPP